MWSYRRIEQKLRRLPQNEEENTPLEYSLRYYLDDAASKDSSSCCEPESEGEVDSDREFPSE